MKKGILVFVFSALALTAATTASARININLDIAPFGFGYARPPVVYQPEPYYEPAPAVYIGGGAYGGDRRGHRDNRDRGNRGRSHGGGGRH